MNNKSESKIVPIESNLFYQSVFKSSMIGQIIIAENLNIIAVNNRMFEYFQAKPCEAEGLLFGSVFHCVNSEKGCVCGNNVKCKNCCIKNAVDDILSGNITIRDTQIEYSFKVNTHHQKKYFLLSGTMIPYDEKQYVTLSFADITDLKHQEEQLRKKLSLDLATGAINKYSLMESIQKITEPETKVSNFTIAMVDFDFFKEINDQYGHLMGDHVLETFSNISRKYIRKHDILGRYGGEEFVFIFPNVGLNQSLRILTRIHRELRESFSNKLNFPVTYSAGLIYIDNVQNTSLQGTDLIGRVDKMLYKAKKHGRNRAVSSLGEMPFCPSDDIVGE